MQARLIQGLEPGKKVLVHNRQKQSAKNNSVLRAMETHPFYSFSNPDPAVFLYADPDPAVFLNVYPDPAVFPYANTDPFAFSTQVRIRLLSQCGPVSVLGSNFKNFFCCTILYKNWLINSKKKHANCPKLLLKC